MKIGMAGIGGIGSNVARNLAQARIKRIKTIDFDHVEVSNLDRQFYFDFQAGEKKIDSLEKNLKAIFPAILVEKVDRRIKPGEFLSLFSDCNVIVEGFDKKNLKKMMIEELSDTSKIVVSASGIAGDRIDTVRTRKIGNCHIVGDFLSDQDRFEIFPPKINIIASIMASIVLKNLRK